VVSPDPRFVLDSNSASGAREASGEWLTAVGAFLWDVAFGRRGTQRLLGGGLRFISPEASLAPDATQYNVGSGLGRGGGGASGGRDLLGRGGFLQRGSCEQAAQIGVDLGKSIVEDAEDLGRHEGEPEHDVCGRKVIADHVGLVS